MCRSGFLPSSVFLSLSLFLSFPIFSLPCLSRLVRSCRRCCRCLSLLFTANKRQHITTSRSYACSCPWLLLLPPPPPCPCRKHSQTQPQVSPGCLCPSPQTNPYVPVSGLGWEKEEGRAGQGRTGQGRVEQRWVEASVAVGAGNLIDLQVTNCA